MLNDSPADDQFMHHSESPEPYTPPVQASTVRRDYGFYPEYDWLEATSPSRSAYRPERLV